MIYNQDIEAQVLSGLINSPEVYPEVAPYLKSEDFQYEVNEVIYTLIRNTLNNKDILDKTVLMSKLADLSITFRDNISPSAYIESLAMNKVPPKVTIQSVKELKKYSLRRNFCEMSKQIIATMKKSGDWQHQEIISFVDQLMYRQLDDWNSETDVINLFDDLYDLIEERGNDPRVEVGIASPYPEFNRLYGGFKQGDVYVFCARPGEGKAQEENSLIPTPKGYTKIKDLKVGDEVFAIDGTVTKVVGTKRWVNRPLYKVSTNDGCIEIVDAEHEWKVKRRADYEWEILTTKFIAEENPLKEKRKVQLPLHEPLQLPERQLPIHPYILGLWLGCSQVWDITCLLVNKKGEKNILREKLRGLNIFDSKRVPMEYLRASQSQRLALLQGLMDSDGSVSAKGLCEFSNSNKDLSEGVVELVRSLGVKCSLNVNASSLNGQRKKDRYRVKFYYKDGFRLRLPRKSERAKNAFKYKARCMEAEYHGVGTTVCIQIEHPSSLYLAGKGMLPTHNSTFLNNTGFKISNMGKNKLPCLILDTEMGQDNAADVKFRLASSLTGINPWYFTTGNWRKNETMENIVRHELVNGKTLKQRMAEYDLHYRYLTNASIDNIISTIKRWYYTFVGRGNPCIIVYDYIKMANEGGGEKEYQIIGEKVNRLKELVGSEVNAPLLTAIQLNRLGDNRGSSYSDTSSAISTSDRVLWFASYVGIFRKKTLDEISEETDQFGTHKLITLKCRFQGRDAAGHNIFVKKPDGKVTYNFLNFTCDNFDVREKCSAEKMYEQLPSNAPPEMPSDEQREEKKIPPNENPF